MATKEKSTENGIRKKMIRVSPEVGILLEEAIVEIKKKNPNNPEEWEKEGEFVEKAIKDRIKKLNKIK